MAMKNLPNNNYKARIHCCKLAYIGATCPARITKSITLMQVALH
jgi:hypothetical protein